MLTKAMEQTLHKVYYDVSHAAGYTGVIPLVRAVKKKHPSIRKQDVEAWNFYNKEEAGCSSFFA